MSDENDDGKGRTRFGDLEKKIVTDSINPGGKPDYLTQRNTRRQMRGLDDARMVRGDESVPAVVPPSVLRGTVLGVVYLVVLAGFVWTGWNAVNMYMGTHGSGTVGRAQVSSCSGPAWSRPGSWVFPVTTCQGFFVPTSQADMRKGVVVTDGVTVIGASSSDKGKEITGANMPSTGTTVYAPGWNGWIWWTVAAVVLLLLLLFLTFRRHGVVPGIRAVLTARAQHRARVHAQELARERARELRRKRAAEAREKAAVKSGRNGKASGKDGKTASKNGKASKEPASAEKPAEKATADEKAAEQPAEKKAAEDAPSEKPDEKKPGEAAAKPAARKPRKKAKNPAHVGTVAGTARRVEAEDLESPSDEESDTADAASAENRSE